MKASTAVALVGLVLAGAQGPALAETDHLEEVNRILQRVTADMKAGKTEHINDDLDRGLAHMCAEFAELRVLQARTMAAVDPPPEVCTRLPQ